RAKPSGEEAGHLPQRIEPKTAWHNGIALKVTFEEPVEPRVASHLQIRHDLALAMRSAILVDRSDPVEHQHGRKRKLGIARSEQFSAPAGDQIVVVIAWSPLSHGPRFESPILDLLVSGRPTTYRPGQGCRIWPIW